MQKFNNHSPTTYLQIQGGPKTVRAWSSICILPFPGKALLWCTRSLWPELVEGSGSLEALIPQLRLCYPRWYLQSQNKIEMWFRRMPKCLCSPLLATVCWQPECRCRKSYCFNCIMILSLGLVQRCWDSSGIYSAVLRRKETSVGVKGNRTLITKWCWLIRPTW